MQKGFLPMLPRHLTRHLLFVAGLTMLLSACGLARNSGGHVVAVQPIEKTATVGSVTKSCVAWRSDAALVKQAGGPLATELSANLKPLDTEFGGYWSSRSSMVAAMDRSIKREQAAIKRMDRAPKEPDASYGAVRADLRSGLVLRLKALRLARKAIASKHDVLLVDAERMDRTALRRYAKGVAGQQNLRSLLEAQCPGGSW
jgi:hypothetical protein